MARRRAGTLEEFVTSGFRAYLEFLAEDRVTFELLRRNAGTIRTMFDDPAVGATEELRADLEAGIASGAVPAHDTELMAAAMVGAAADQVTVAEPSCSTASTDSTPATADSASRAATRVASARNGSLNGLPTAVTLRPDVSSIPIRYMPVSTRNPSVVVQAVLRCIATTGTPCAIQSYTHDSVRWLYSGPAPPSSTTSGVSGALGPPNSLE